MMRNLNQSRFVDFVDGAAQAAKVMIDLPGIEGLPLRNGKQHRLNGSSNGEQQAAFGSAHGFPMMSDRIALARARPSATRSRTNASMLT